MSQFTGMHKVLHNFGDWELETRHMTRLEKSIYFDARTLYLKESKPLTDDLPLLERLLMCHSDDEKQALAFVLSHKFVHDKKSKRYKHREWDLIIKNYRFFHRNDVTPNDNDVTDDVTHDVTHDVTANDRIKALRNRNKQMIEALKQHGINANSRMKSKDLQALCQKHGIVIDNDVTHDVTDDVTANDNDVTDDVTKNEPKNHAITINQEPITINQEPKSESNARTQKTQKDKTQTPTFDPIAFLQANGVDSKTASDFVNYKKSKLKKGEGITEQMLVMVKNQAQKTGKISFGDALKIIMATGKWAGFQADWNWQSWYEAVLLTENRPIPDWLKQQPKFGGDNDPLAVNRHWQNNNESKVVGGFVIPPVPTNSNIQKW